MHPLWTALLASAALLLDLLIVLALRARRVRRTRPPSQATPSSTGYHTVGLDNARQIAPDDDRRLLSRVHLAFLGCGLLVGFLGCWLLGSTDATALNVILIVSGGILLAAGVGLGPARMRWAWSGEWAVVIARWLGVRSVQVPLICTGILLALAARSASGDSPRSSYPWYWLLWLAGICLTVIGCWSGPSRTGRATDRLDLLAALSLAAFALMVRLPGLEHLPGVLRGDEGTAGLEGIKFLRGTSDNVLITGWHRFPSLYFWIVSIGQRWLGPNAAGIRLASALAGSGAVIASYLWARSMFGRLTGYMAALLLAALDLHVLFSRVGLNNIFDTLSLTLSMAALWSAWQTGDRRSYLLLGLAIGISPFFYISGRMVPLLVLAALLVMRLQPSRPPNIPGLAAAAFVSLSICLPLGLFYVRYPSYWAFPLLRVALGEGGALAIPHAGDLLAGAWMVLGQAGVTFSGIVTRPLVGFYASGMPVLMPLEAGLFIAGLLLCATRWRDPRSVVLLLALGATIASGALSVEAPSSQRLLFASPVIAILCALPLGQLFTALQRRRVRFASAAAAALVGLTLVLAALNLDRLVNKALPQHAYWDDFAEMTTLAGRYLARLPHPLSVSFLPHAGVSHKTGPPLVYLAGEVEWTDLPDPILGLQDIPPVQPPYVFLALPARFDELEVIRRTLPGGIIVDGIGDRGTLVFRALEYLQ